MSRTTEYLKHRIICSPLGPGAASARRKLRDWRKLRAHPELSRLFQEDAFTDRVLAKLLTPGTNCIDAGCHLGSMLSAFHRLSPRGRHVAVEAIPHKAAWLRARFPRATVHNVALGDRSGEVTFHLDMDASARSSMHTNTNTERTTKLTLPMKPLDELLEPGFVCGFFKIDVEGAELMVLRGAARMIARDAPPVLFECAPQQLVPFGYIAQDLYREFVAIGYAVWLMDDFLGGRTPIAGPDEFALAQKYPPQARNFLALPVKG